MVQNRSKNGPKNGPKIDVFEARACLKVSILEFFDQKVVFFWSKNGVFCVGFKPVGGSKFNNLEVWRVFGGGFLVLHGEFVKL